MRRACFAVALIAGLVSAPPALADSVVAKGRAGLFGNITADVRSGPSGEHPSGQISMKWNARLIPPGLEHINDPGTPMYTGGTVTCLAVRGRVAVFNFRPTPELQMPEMLGDGITTVEMVDNAGRGIRDDIRAFPLGRAPSDCSPWARGPTEMVDHFYSGEGDLTVVDDRGPGQYVAACAKAGGRKVGRGKTRRCVPVRAAACKGKAYKRKFGFKKRSRCVAAAKKAPGSRH
jgi:hypothetical protein